MALFDVRGDLPCDDAQLNDDFLAGIEHLSRAADLRLLAGERFERVIAP